MDKQEHIKMYAAEYLEPRYYNNLEHINEEYLENKEVYIDCFTSVLDKLFK